MDSVEKGNHHPRIGLISSLGLVCRIWAHCLTQGHPHPISPTLFWMYHFGGSIKGGVPLESSVEIGCSLTNHPAIGVPTGYPHHKEPPFLCKISAPRCSQTLSELLRFFRRCSCSTGRLDFGPGPGRRHPSHTGPTWRLPAACQRGATSHHSVGWIGQHGWKKSLKRKGIVTEKDISKLKIMNDS